METIRQKKIATLIKQEISKIFRYEISYQQKLISVSQVYVSPDLALSRIHLSIFPIEENKKILSHITWKSKHYRNLLARRLCNQLRKIPKINFYLDNSLNDLENIDRQLRGEGENPITI